MSESTKTIYTFSWWSSRDYEDRGCGVLRTAIALAELRISSANVCLTSYLAADTLLTTCRPRGLVPHGWRPRLILF